MGNIVIFCNGINNTPESAQTLADNLQSQIDNECEYAADVELKYNNACDTTSCTMLTVSTITTAIGLVILGKTFLWDKQPSDKQFICGSLISLIGITLICNELANIESRKDLVAKKLADRITEKFAQNPTSNIILCLHSQGADVGDRAIAKLGSLKNRISIVTIGASRFTNLSQCRHVQHIANSTDWIPNFVAHLRSSNSMKLQRNCFKHLPTSYCQNQYGLSEKSGFTSFRSTDFRHNATDYQKRNETMESICGLLLPSKSETSLLKDQEWSDDTPSGRISYAKRDPHQFLRYA